MAVKYMVQDASGNVTTDAVSFMSNQVEVGVAGTFTSVKFEDQKFGLGWADVLDANTGEVLEITEATNEIEFLAAGSVGREVRAVITGGTNVTIFYDEGVGGGTA